MTLVKPASSRKRLITLLLFGSLADPVIKSCAETTFGCCPDSVTAALVSNNAGCPGRRFHSHDLFCTVGHKNAAILLRTKAATVFSASQPSQFCLSVRLSVTRVDQSRTVQDGITKSSPSAARKTLVSGTVKLFHKFEGSHPERGP